MLSIRVERVEQVVARAWGAPYLMFETRWSLSPGNSSATTCGLLPREHGGDPPFLNCDASTSTGSL